MAQTTENRKKLDVYVVVKVLVFICSSVMAGYQCWTMTETYFEYSVLQQREFISNETLAFPAVTLCSNNPVNWLLLKKENHSILKWMDEFEANSTLQLKNFLIREGPLKCDFDCTGIFQFQRNRIFSLLRALQNIPERERIRFSTSKKSLDMSCSFGTQNCTYKNVERGPDGINFINDNDEWLITNSLYYGNCRTFNHVFSQDGSTVSEIQGLKFSFTNELAERIPDIGRNPTSIVVIHSVGTAPVMSPSNMINIYPGDNLDIFVDQIVSERLPAPYPSKCVDSFDEVVKRSTVYFHPDRPYIYSLDACKRTCVQRRRIESCGCGYPDIPIGPNSDGFSEYPICYSKPELSGCFYRKISETKCNCYIPCKETKLTWTVSVASSFSEELLLKSYNEYTLSGLKRINKKLRSVDSTLFDRSKRLNMLRSAVSVQMKSTMYEKITEVPKITVVDVLGIIGGNIGLWLGVSVLSIYDVLEWSSRKISLFSRTFFTPKAAQEICRDEKGPAEVTPVMTF